MIEPSNAAPVGEPVRETTPAPPSGAGHVPKSKPINYSLRPAKNIERKMMAEALTRLSRLAPLADYRYIGFGSEFFNDFLLFHETLGIPELISIERDVERIERCKFNRPFQCIDVREGTASAVLETLLWNKLSVVWLDYTGRLNEEMIKDAQLVVSQAPVGSMLIWSFNADPWGPINEGTGSRTAAADLSEMRLRNLKHLVGHMRVRSELKGTELGGWGLAREFHSILIGEIASTLNDRSASCSDEDRIHFRQCFHFRYRDSARMLTVGGVLLHKWAEDKFGPAPFAGLSFTRSSDDAFEIKPPMLTGREARYLSSRMPGSLSVDWLSDEEVANYREIYRYFPIFAESEL
jgi:hypothetical protein